jgi:hypothetical protein
MSSRLTVRMRLVLRISTLNTVPFGDSLMLRILASPPCFLWALMPKWEPTSVVLR